MLVWLHAYVPVNSKTAHLTRVKLRTVGNLTQTEAHPRAAAFDFRFKTSVSGQKQKDFAIMIQYAGLKV